MNERILLLRGGGALGDFVLTLPAIAGIPAHLPHAVTLPPTMSISKKRHRQEESERLAALEQTRNSHQRQDGRQFSRLTQVQL